MVNMKGAGPLIAMFWVLVMVVLVKACIASDAQTPSVPQPTQTVILEQAEWVKE